MAERKTSWQDGHRERLREKFLTAKLVDYELMELLLSYAIPRRDVRPLARDLLRRYGGIYQILMAPDDELVAVPGMGKSTVTYIKVLYHLMLRGYKGALQQNPVFFEYEQLMDYCRLLVAGKKIEEFHILYLDKTFRLIAEDLHSSGTVDWAAAYPREIVKRALDLSARQVVLLHNHPTPNMSFSQEDIEMTRKIQAMLHTMDIEVWDHLLVSGTLVYSARNMFLLMNSPHPGATPMPSVSGDD